ncbi:Fanconi anemia group F protein [Liparis tanakae]|uniref:Fanconi anemia group F protein n=1 Tax=Liparis tanakae TaxID=230148 RepID=A0A4Z2JAB0_9TELE|nr:Fanconi anemia group F protein [Liparis tanakae]
MGMCLSCFGGAADDVVVTPDPEMRRRQLAEAAEKRQKELYQAGSLHVVSKPRGQRHMEAVLRNLASTAELLAVAGRSGEVERWDEPTLTRAFQWARYCEHLFSRFHRNPAIRVCMERQLQLSNQGLRAAFEGYIEVSFSDLSRCQHLLLVGLLGNPELPISIMKTLFDTPSPVCTKQSEGQDVTGFCSRIIQCKSACKVLSPLTDGSAVGADAEVQAAMLMERLDALLSQGSEACRTEHILGSVLRGFEGAPGHFCLVIAAALLTKKNSAAKSASRDFLLDWLQREQRVLQHMCSALPAALIIDLTKEHRTFRDAYWNLLKKWASDMEYSLSEGDWVQTGTNPTVSFDRLSEHLLGLCETGPSLRKEVEKELNALKVSDGDYDVRGLSVWADLLSTLNKSVV